MNGKEESHYECCGYRTGSRLYPGFTWVGDSKNAKTAPKNENMKRNVLAE
jgi:hypothetical protein